MVRSLIFHCTYLHEITLTLNWNSKTAFVHYGIFAIELKRLSVSLHLCKKREKLTNIWQKLLGLELFRGIWSCSANATQVGNPYSLRNERKICASLMVKWSAGELNTTSKNNLQETTYYYMGDKLSHFWYALGLVSCTLNPFCLQVLAWLFECLNVGVCWSCCWIYSGKIFSYQLHCHR